MTSAPIETVIGRPENLSVVARAGVLAVPGLELLAAVVVAKKWKHGRFDCLDGLVETTQLLQGAALGQVPTVDDQVRPGLTHQLLQILAQHIPGAAPTFAFLYMGIGDLHQPETAPAPLRRRHQIEVEFPILLGHGLVEAIDRAKPIRHTHPHKGMRPGLCLQHIAAIRPGPDHVLPIANQHLSHAFSGSFVA